MIFRHNGIRLRFRPMGKRPRAFAISDAPVSYELYARFADASALSRRASMLKHLKRALDPRSTGKTLFARLKPTYSSAPIGLPFEEAKALAQWLELELPTQAEGLTVARRLPARIKRSGGLLTADGAAIVMVGPKRPGVMTTASLSGARPPATFLVARRTDR